MANRKVTDSQIRAIVEFAGEYSQYAGDMRRDAFLAEWLRERRIRITANHARRIMRSVKCPKCPKQISVTKPQHLIELGQQEF